jgi:hypothetical protein
MDGVVMNSRGRAPEALDAPGAFVHPGADRIPRGAVAALDAR